MNTLIYDELHDIVKSITTSKEEYGLICEEILMHFEGWKPFIQDLHPKAQQALTIWEEENR